jgi:DNA repair protein RecO (recombination protein O)
MPLHKDEGIILFKRAYGESDKIVRLFTLGSGKVAAIAKGANKSQKRFMNTLEPFNHISLEYFEKYGKGMVRLENAHTIETNEGIEKSLKKVCMAGFFTEFVDKLTRDREKHIELFYMLKEVLTTIKQNDLTYSDVLAHELSMLQTLGFEPNFHTCVYCGKPIHEDDRTYFSSERGGTLCHRCARFIAHKKYDEGVIARLATMREREGANSISRESGGNYSLCDDGSRKDAVFERDARDLLEGFVSFHLDVEFKSYRILKNIMR